MSDKIRFLLIGTFNAGISYIIYALFCLILGVEAYQLSLALAWIISSFASYTTQRLFVFNVKGNIILQYLKCCTTWAMSYVINAAVLEFFVKKIGLNVYIAQILATLACAIFTYILLKKFAFKINKNKG